MKTTLEAERQQHGGGIFDIEDMVKIGREHKARRQGGSPLTPLSRLLVPDFASLILHQPHPPPPLPSGVPLLSQPLQPRRGRHYPHALQLPH